MFLVRPDDAVLEVTPPARMRQSPMPGQVVRGSHCHTHGCACHCTRRIKYTRRTDMATLSSPSPLMQ